MFDVTAGLKFDEKKIIEMGQGSLTEIAVTAKRGQLGHAGIREPWKN